MAGFKHYKRKELSEMRPYVLGESMDGVSVSEADQQLETLEGGYIARNPKNHDDKWYVAKQYFEDNLEEAYMAAEDALDDAKLFGLDFGQAICAAKEGKKVARSGWNGNGMFAYIVPANSYPTQTGVAREYFGEGLVPYREYWALKTAQDDVATWAPSGSDSLAEDWCIVE